MSNDDYEDKYDAPAPKNSSGGGLIPSAGMLAAILAVLAWIVLLLGIIQITVQLLWVDQGVSLTFRQIILISTSLWSAIVAWGLLMLAAVIARFISHRDE